jgi:hypothetical protein
VIGDIFRLIVDVIQFAWPFRIVRQWELGGYYWFGRFCHTVGPGVYPIVWWFSEVREISVVPAIVRTARLDITLSDGSSLTFAASAWARVTDYDRAVNSVDNYTETTEELMAAVLAEQLAVIDAVRVEPEKRKGLIKTLTKAINEESTQFGVEVTQLRFTTFVTKARTYRLLQDSQAQPSW